MRRNIIIPNKRKTWLQSPLLAVFLVLVLIWLCFVVFRVSLKYREAATLRNQYRNELTELQKKETDLNSKITNLSTERGLEAEVRNRYRVVRPGEQLVIVVDNTSATTAETIDEKPSFWEKFLKFVGF